MSEPRLTEAQAARLVVWIAAADGLVTAIEALRDRPEDWAPVDAALARYREARP